MPTQARSFRACCSLVKLTDSSHTTLTDYLENAKEKHENTVYYTTDTALQAQYISLFEAQEIRVAHFDKQFEVQFLSMLEQQMEGVKFVRVDADVASVLKEEKGRAPLITIGKDTRISSDMLESALISGICSVGGNVMPFGGINRNVVAKLIHAWVPNNAAAPPTV